MKLAEVITFHIFFDTIRRWHIGEILKFHWMNRFFLLGFCFHGLCIFKKTWESKHVSLRIFFTFARKVSRIERERKSFERIQYERQFSSFYFSWKLTHSICEQIVHNSLEFIHDSINDQTESPSTTVHENKRRRACKKEFSTRRPSKKGSLSIYFPTLITRIIFCGAHGKLILSLLLFLWDAR